MLRGRVLGSAMLLVLVLPLLLPVLPAPSRVEPSGEARLAERVGGDRAVTLPLPGAGRTITIAPSDRSGLAPDWVAGLVVLALAVWAVGAGLGLVRLWRSHALVRRLVRAARPPGEGDLVARLRRCRDDLGLRRPVELLLSNAVPGPFSVGWLRPRIVLPAEARRWSGATVDSVLRHELAHVERGDNALALAASLVAVLHWCDPLAWLVRSRLRREVEQACDDAVLRRGVRASVYARVLLERSLAEPATALALAPATTFACQAARRMRTCLDPAVDRRPAGFGASLSVVAALAAVILLLTPLRPPPAAVQDLPDDAARIAAITLPPVTTDDPGEGGGPEWWREMRAELGEVRAIRAWQEDPSLGVRLPDGVFRDVGDGWTVEVRDAMALAGTKYGCLFTSDEGYVRISRPANGDSFRFSVSAVPHPPVGGLELAVDRFLSSFGLGCDGDFRAYRIDHYRTPENLARFRSVVAALAADPRTGASPSLPED
jgi:beta-lactamase regulating signal transducer with metallopeptidase domain